MPHAETPLDRLLALLPEAGELTPFRQALLRATLKNSAQGITREIFDKRLLPQSSLRTIAQEAAREAHERLQQRYDAMADAIELAASGEAERATEIVIEMGEASETSEDYASALVYFDVARRLAEDASCDRLRGLALRRLARAQLAVADVERSRDNYTQSIAYAKAAADSEGEISALIGLGNLSGAFQGRWSEAVSLYMKAIERCGPFQTRLRGQALINLGTALREWGSITEAHEVMEQAVSVWGDLSDGEHSGWYNGWGLQLMAEGKLDEAEEVLQKSLDKAQHDFDRSMILDNLAEIALKTGKLDLAEEYTRSAEAIALQTGSARALAEIYVKLGRILAAKDDAVAEDYFRTAIEICKGRSLPLVEARASIEFSLYRRSRGAAAWDGMSPEPLMRDEAEKEPLALHAV